MVRSVRIQCPIQEGAEKRWTARHGIDRPAPASATSEDETCGAPCRRPPPKQIMQCAGRGRLDRRWRRARRISADWIREEGFRPDQADSPDTDQDSPNLWRAPRRRTKPTANASTPTKYARSRTLEWAPHYAPIAVNAVLGRLPHCTCWRPLRGRVHSRSRCAITVADCNLTTPDRRLVADLKKSVCWVRRPLR
jgi:hypothetical protein